MLSFARSPALPEAQLCLKPSFARSSALPPAQLCLLSSLEPFRHPAAPSRWHRPQRLMSVGVNKTCFVRSRRPASTP